MHEDYLTWWSMPLTTPDDLVELVEKGQRHYEVLGPLLTVRRKSPGRCHLHQLEYQAFREEFRHPAVARLQKNCLHRPLYEQLSPWQPQYILAQANQTQLECVQSTPEFVDAGKWRQF
jgi:hypothetical protein